MRSHRYANVQCMRTTLDLPEPLLRRLKASAALEGTTLKQFMRDVIERGLRTPVERTSAPDRRAESLPTIRLGRPLNLPHPSNAALFDLLDD